MPLSALKSYTARQLANRIISEVELRAGAGVVRSMPTVVDVVLTKACNLACTFCKDYETEGAQHVSEANLTRLAEQLFPTARRLSICSGGEPYLHRGLEHILRQARNYRLYTWVLSNGMLLKEERMRPIIREQLITEHGFSIDGIRPETVEAIRVFAKLPKILENVRMVQRIRDEEGKPYPTITIRYALMRCNIEELPAAVQYWGENGANRIDCGYLSLANGIPQQESLFFHQELTKKIFVEARRVVDSYPSLQLTLPALVEDDLARRENPTRCHAPWTFINVDPNGVVMPCYKAFEAISMGKIYDEDGRPFRELWNSESYQALRRTVNREGGKKHYAYCQSCEARYGWGTVDAHLGDQTWLKVVSQEKPELVQINHRRLKK